MKKSDLIKLLIVVLFLVSFLFSWANTNASFNSDLRNRIVGIRTFEINEDPYHYISNNKLPDKLIDPFTSPYSIVTRLTIPPTLVLMHLPLSTLPYPITKIIWFLIEWLLFLITMYLLQDLTRNNTKKILLWASGLIFTLSYTWHLHTILGQIYIFYTSLLALVFWLYKAKNNPKAAGIIISITAILRPPILLVLLPFLFFDKELAKKTKIFLSSFLVGFLLTLGVCYIFTPNLWHSYLKSIVFARTLFPMTSSDRQFHPQAYYPKTVEGTPFFSHSSSILIEDSSLKGIAGKKLHINMPNIYLYFIFALITVALAKHIKRTKDYRFVSLFVYGTMLLNIGEYFIPAARYSYFDIQMYVPIALIVIYSKHAIKLIISFSFLLLLGYFFPITSSLLTTTYLSTVLYRKDFKTHTTNSIIT